MRVFGLLVVGVIAGIITTIGCIRVTRRARKRMQKALNQPVGDGELASLDAWMKVKGVEQSLKRKHRR